MSEPASHPPLSSDAPPESATADAPDPRIARAEQRLAMLRELAELGMALTRELTRRAMAAPETPEAAPDATPASRHPPRHDPADSFARLSRAVRLTLALEATVEEQLSTLRAGGLGPAAPGSVAAANNDDDLDRFPPRDYPSAHRNTIRDAVYEIINREVTELIPAQDMLDTLYERLTEGERYDAFIHRPLRETVEAICEDLDLHPDWSRWTDDGWSHSEPWAYAWHRMWGPPSRRNWGKRRLQ